VISTRPVDAHTLDRASPPRRLSWARLAERLHLPTLLVVLLGVGIWSVLSPLVGAYLLPSPISVLTGFGTIVSGGQIWVHVGATLYRVSIGFCVALALSLASGFLTARLAGARQVTRDLTAILNSTSVFVWIVLAMIWFGLTDSAPMFTTCMIVLPVMLSTVHTKALTRWIANFSRWPASTDSVTSRVSCT
jgi:NitT/TauT family transport system permease protein